MSIHLIRGCPGAGKTRTLSIQAQRAVEAYGASNVAIASLTKTAAAEIAGRDTNVPDEQVGTLHAHAFRALECTREEMAETGKHLREFAADHPELDVGDAGHSDLLDEMPAEGSGVHAAVQNHRARMTPVEQWSSDEQAYGAAWDDFKQRRGLRDFTDLIETAGNDPDILPLMQGLFFDECADFSALEFRMLIGWAARAKTTVLSADPDQAIFQWRGADPAALAALPFERTIPLAQSYRCSRAVRDAALTWIDTIEDRTPLIWEPTDEPGEVLEQPLALRDDTDLLDLIRSLDGTVMILTTCGYMLNGTIDMLRREGIPFGNAHRRKEVRWNPCRGPVYTALSLYLRTRSEVWGEAVKPRTWGDLHAWTQHVSASGLARGAKAAIEAHCMTDQFGETHAGETVPLTTLVDLLGTATHPALRGDVDWWLDALMLKHRRAGEYAARVYKREPRALVAEPRLTVGTVHSVKGGSADHVLLAPELSKEGYFGEHGWMGDGRSATVRLGYVGMTRARSSVHLLEPATPEYMPIADVLRETRRAAA